MPYHSPSGAGAQSGVEIEQARSHLVDAVPRFRALPRGRAEFFAQRRIAEQE
jgi:hypothetical protein